MEMATVQQIKEITPERNFTQSVDLAITIQNIDLKQPENRIDETIPLPHQATDNRVCVIGDNVSQKANNADRVLDSDELEECKNDHTQAKQLADAYEFFIAEADLMQDIAKSLGIVFGPRGKMPEPLPPGGDPTSRIDALKKSVKIRLKDNPVIQCKIGTETMENGALQANAEAVIEFVTNQLPKGQSQIKDIRLKLTMGPPVKVQ